MKTKSLLLLGIIFVCGCANKISNMKTVNSVDLNKYSGLWYEIARFPNSFEKDCSCVTAKYNITNEGFVEVINSCNKNGKRNFVKGKAFVVSNSNNTKLKVQFFWPFKGDYWIIGLADDYSWSIVSEPKGKYLWILSRQPKISPTDMEKILRIIDDNQLDSNKLIYTNQINNCND